MKTQFIQQKVYTTSDGINFVSEHEARQHERVLASNRIKLGRIYRDSYWSVYDKKIVSATDLSLAYDLRAQTPPSDDKSNFWFIATKDGGHIGGYDVWSTQEEFLRAFREEIREAENRLEYLKDIKFRITDPI